MTSAATKIKTKTETTSVKNRIIIEKLFLTNKHSITMENNNETVEFANLSDLDILDQTTIEIELSGNKPSVQNDTKDDHDSGEVLEIPEEESSEEEHDAELNPNNDPSNETNEEQLRYVFNTVEGERYIIQGTSDRRVEMITLDRGGNQSAQEDSDSESETEVIEFLTAKERKEPGNMEREYQNIQNMGRDLRNLMDSVTEAAERRIENNNENGSQNPNPEEVLEIPDEETSEEEHDTDCECELENANQQAWENCSAAQKKYLETLEAGQTQRKLILRCMRTPGEVRLNRLLIGAPDLSMENWEELTEKCLSDNAVVRLDRNDIPNWYRAQG